MGDQPRGMGEKGSVGAIHRIVLVRRRRFVGINRMIEFRIYRALCATENLAIANLKFWGVGIACSAGAPQSSSPPSLSSFGEKAGAIAPQSGIPRFNGIPAGCDHSSENGTEFDFRTIGRGEAVS
jgi:hypothetical protein